NTVVGYDTFDKAFNDLNASRIDGLLIDEDYARYYVAHQSNPNDYTITTGGFLVNENAVGFRKADKKLRQAVNKELKTYKKDGRLQKYSTKWFGN
ncbi:MAG: transporter substrate-binding domain-containing protein, partial [Leuconostoc mesenteroides]